MIANAGTVRVVISVGVVVGVEEDVEVEKQVIRQSSAHGVGGVVVTDSRIADQAKQGTLVRSTPACNRSGPRLMITMMAGQRPKEDSVAHVVVLILLLLQHQSIAGGVGYGSRCFQAWARESDR